MTGPDVQIVRAEIILGTKRPQPEPTEGELRAVLEHLGATIVSRKNTTENTTAEAAR
jgi:hypothetical protein